MPFVYQRSFLPSALLPVQTDPALDQLLASLLDTGINVPIEDIPAVAGQTLVNSVILPQVAQMIYHAVGTVKNVTGIANDICVCDALDRISQALEKKTLKVTVTQYPVQTDVIQGQNGGPDILFPLGWVNFEMREVGWLDRQFINSSPQLFFFPGSLDFWDYKLYLKPGVQAFAVVL